MILATKAIRVAGTFVVVMQALSVTVGGRHYRAAIGVRWQ